MKQSEPIRLIDSVHEVYVPREFVRRVPRAQIEGAREGALEALASGPDHPKYWGAWDEVLRDVTVIDPVSGARYSVEHDGDCWLIPCEHDDSAEPSPSMRARIRLAYAYAQHVDSMPTAAD